MSTRTVLVCDNCKRDTDALPYRLRAPSWPTVTQDPEYGHNSSPLLLWPPASPRYAPEANFCSPGCALNYAAKALHAQTPPPAKPTIVERLTGKRRAKK